MSTRRTERDKERKTKDVTGMKGVELGGKLL